MTEKIKINIRHKTTGQASSENIKQDIYIYTYAYHNQIAN